MFEVQVTRQPPPSPWTVENISKLVRQGQVNVNNSKLNEPKNLLDVIKNCLYAVKKKITIDYRSWEVISILRLNLGSNPAKRGLEGKSLHCSVF